MNVLNILTCFSSTLYLPLCLQPNFDMEYAAIVAAKASSLKALPVTKTSDSLLSVLPALPKDFHPVNDIMSLIRDRRGRSKKGKGKDGAGKGGANGLRSLLCATFIEATPSELNRVLANMKVMKGYCDWAVIVHPSLGDLPDSSSSRDVHALRGSSTAPAALNRSTSANTAGSAAGSGSASASKEAMLQFTADAKATGVDLVMLQETEPQQVVLKRYASRSNKLGTDAGGDSSDALARDALQQMNPEMYKQYLKFASPSTVADRTGLEEEKEKRKKDGNAGEVASSSNGGKSGNGAVAAPDKTGIVAGQQIGVWDEELEEAAVIRPDRGDIPLYNNRVYPKTLQFTYLLSILPKYRKVWLLDSDISLHGFHPEPFFRIIECAFEEPPIIAQPLITSSSKDTGGKAQSYKYLNEQYWKSDRENGQVDAASTSFIEIQAPLMNAAYFEWFVTRMVIPLLAPSHFLGADWGFDNLFCTTAGLYRSLTKVRTPAGAEGSAVAGKGKERGRQLLQMGSLSPACVVTVGADPIHHLNVNAQDISNNVNYKQHHDTISHAQAHTRKKMRERLNKEMMSIIRELMPNFFMSGHGKESDPKSNAYATARLDAQLSKDMKCK